MSVQRTTQQHNATPVTVYTPGFRSVLSLARSSILHLPDAHIGAAHRLVLCANFDSAKPQTSCSMGDNCKFVHAVLTPAVREHSIHVNYAWRSLEEVTYDRLPAGRVLRVAPPNSKQATDVMDSNFVLKTRALTSNRRPLSHCAHYYFNRTCNMGPDCQFVHAVFIDPEAKPFQRAPVPSQLGEGRELQLSKKQREARRRDGSTVGEYAASVTTLDAVARMPSSSQLSSLTLDAVASDSSSTPRSNSQCCSGAASCCAGTANLRFRYNPYSIEQPKLVLCACTA